LQIYDLGARHLLRQEDFSHRISALGFSNDGGMLAIALADDNEVQIEESQSGRVRWRRGVGSNYTEAFAFSSDDRTLGVGGRDSAIHIVAAQSGHALNDLHGQESGVLNMIWSRQGTDLYSAGSGGDVRRWRNPMISSRHEFGGLWAAPMEKHYACLSSDGVLFAATVGNDRLGVVDTRRGEAFASTQITASVPLAFDHGGAELLTLSRDGLVQRWALAPAAVQQTEYRFPLGQSTIVCGNISRSRNRLIAGDSGGRVRFLDLSAGKLIGDRQAHNGMVWWTAISPTGELAVSAGADKMVRIWSFDSAKLLSEWSESASFAQDAAFSGNSRWLAICFHNGEVEIRDTKAFRRSNRWKTDSPALEQLAFSSDSRRLFCGGANGTIHVYDTSDWHEVATLVAGSRRGDSTVGSLAISERDNALLAYREDGLARIWQAAR